MYSRRWQSTFKESPSVQMLLSAGAGAGLSLSLFHFTALISPLRCQFGCPFLLEGFLMTLSGGGTALWSSGSLSVAYLCHDPCCNCPDSCLQCLVGQPGEDRDQFTSISVFPTPGMSHGTRQVLSECLLNEHCANKAVTGRETASRAPEWTLV